MKRQNLPIVLAATSLIVVILSGSFVIKQGLIARVWCQVTHHQWVRHYSNEPIWVYNSLARDDRRPLGYKYNYFENSVQCDRCNKHLFSVHIQDSAETPITTMDVVNGATSEEESAKKRFIVLNQNTLGSDVFRRISCQTERNRLNGLCEELDLEGNVLGQWHTKNDRMHGEAFFNRTDRSKAWEGSFSDGKLSGQSHVYWPNGQLKRIDSYSHGYAEGISLLYDDHGRIVWKRSFVRGLRHGPTEEYYDSGAVKFRGVFESGSAVLTYYDESGKVIGEANADKGIVRLNYSKELTG